MPGVLSACERGIGVVGSGVRTGCASRLVFSILSHLLDFSSSFYLYNFSLTIIGYLVLKIKMNLIIFLYNGSQC